MTKLSSCFCDPVLRLNHQAGKPEYLIRIRLEVHCLFDLIELAQSGYSIIFYFKFEMSSG